jgi:hypothetical protein
MARKRKNAQKIKTHLRARSTAQLEKSLEGLLDIPDPKEAPDFDSEEWAGPSPPHMINGRTYEEIEEIKKKRKEEKREKDEKRKKTRRFK